MRQLKSSGKQAIAVILVCTLVLAGCASPREISIKDLEATSTVSKGLFRITTKGGEVYRVSQFTRDDAAINVLEMSRMHVDTPKPAVPFLIPLSDISSIQDERGQDSNTFFIFVGIVAAVVLFTAFRNIPLD